MSNYLEPLVGNRMLGEGSVGVIVDSDEKGTILFVSPGAERLFRVPYSGELLGRSIEELVPAEFRDKHRAWRLEFNNNPRVRRMGLGRELRGLRRDGTEFNLEIELSPFTDPATGRLLIRAFQMSMEGRTAILPKEKA